MIDLYIYKIEIKNFRGIEHLVWKPNKERNVIIGENGSGKSTLGSALDYLLNPYINWYNRTMSEMEYYNRNMDNEIFIEVWFKDLKEFIIDDGDLYFEHINEKDEISGDGKDIVLITRFIADKKGDVTHSIISNGSEHVLRQKQKGLIDYKYISSERDPLKELSFKKNSTLYKLFENEKVNLTLTEIIKEFNVESSTKLMENDSFNSQISRLHDNFSNFNLIKSDKDSIKVEATELNEMKAIQSFSLVSKGNESEVHIPIKYQSRGIKNLMLLLSLQDINNKVQILFLEEPEQNLEPFMQKRIIKNFQESENGQMFITTHSADVCKMYDFKDIFLMKKGKIINMPDLEKIDNNNKFSKHIERYQKRELISGLFAKGILLVEGPSEMGGLPIFADQTEYGLNYSGIEIFKAEGKDNIFKYAKFYTECEMPVICLVDNDSDINELFKKFKRNRVECLILKQPCDYEALILTLDSFKENWKEIFEYKYPLKGQKDTYLKILRDKELELFSDHYNSKYDKFNDRNLSEINSLTEVEELLTEEQLSIFQKEFLHRNMADVINAKYISNILVDIAKEEELEDIIPRSLIYVFKIINIYMANRLVCENSEHCILNSKNKENICSECVEQDEDFRFVFKIKENENESNG